jgi:hypothetical protein
MADSAAPPTPEAQRRPPGKRRARAAPSEADDRPARTAIAVEPPSPAGRSAGAAIEPSADLFSADDEFAAHTMNLDPRQGTLAGFELSAEALVSLRDRQAMAPVEARQNRVVDGQATVQPATHDAAPRVAAAADAPREKGATEEGTTEPVILEEPTRQLSTALSWEAPAFVTGDSASRQTAPPSSTALAVGGGKPHAARRRKAVTVASTASYEPGSGAPQADSSPLPASELAAEPGAVATPNGCADTADGKRRADPSSGSESSAGPSPRGASDETVLQTMAALQAAVAEDRRAARQSRTLAARHISIAMALLAVAIVLGVVQTVIAMRAARESAAAQQKIEALLRAQQTELAAFIDAASAASADVRRAADALDAGSAALSRLPAASPPTIKRAPRALHPHRASERPRVLY